MKNDKKKYGHLLALAISIITDAFKTTLDRGDSPYALHCLAVMNSVRDLGFLAMIVAVLHDLLEDCPEWTAKRLYDVGFPEEVVSRVVILTRKSDEDYMSQYIARVSLDNICRRCKMGDLEHNMELGRIRGLTQKDFVRTQKYQTAYVYLSEAA